MAVTNTATAGTTWAGATWSQGHVPTSSEDVVINSGVNLTIGTAAVAGSLTIGNATATATTLTIGSGGSLVVSGTTGNLSINPSAVGVNMTLAVGAQTLTVGGTVSVGANKTQTISVSTGTITFNSAISLTTTNAAISDTSTGTINFNGGFTDGNSVLSVVSGSIINFGGNYTVQTAAVSWTAGSTAVFTGSSMITPTTAITFANLQINSGPTVTLGGNITVGGSWTNNGGTLSGGANTVSFGGTSNTIGGTSSTDFPNLTISAGAVYTMNTSATATSLTLPASATATSLTQASGVSFTVNGNVTINQPTASGITEAWNVNAGTAHVTGTVTIGGTNTTTTRVATIAVTSGSCTIDGAVTYGANSAGASNEVITVSTGTITLGSALNLSSGKLSDTSTGTINFNGAFTVGGANAPSFTEVSGSTINFGGSFTVNTTAYTFTSGSTAVFTGNSTVTPTAAITFDKVQINSGVTVTLAGNIAVSGDWTNNGGTLSGGGNTVTLSGASKTIGGTSSTDFPGLTIASGASYTMNNSNTATSLTFTAAAAASSLTQASGTTLTVNGTVTINQPTASSVTTAWNINAGSASIAGNVSIGSTNTTTSRIAKVAITTGTLTITGNLVYNSSATTAGTAVVDLSGGAGTLNLAGSLTLTNNTGTLSPGTSGSIVNYNGSAAGQTVTLASAITYNNLNLNNTNASGATLGAAISASNVTGNIRVQTGTFSNGGLAIAGSAGDTFQVANGATFKVAGTTSAFPTGFGPVTLGATSTVDYSGTGAQTIAAQNYGNLTISAARGANNVTLVNSGTIGVAGTLSDTATFTAGNGFVTTGSTVAYNGSGSQTVTVLLPIVAGSVMYNNLTINNASGVTLGGNVNVGGIMTFTGGTVTTGASSVYIAAGGSVSRTSGHVVGNFKKNIATGATSKTFEIGDASNYTPVTVSFASVTVAGDLTGTTTTGDHPNVGSSAINSAKTANRYWTLTNSGIVFTNYSVTFNFVSGDLDSGANTSNFIVGKFNSSTWTYPTVGTKTSNSTQATGLTSFSDFQVGESSTTATWTGAVSNLWSNGGNWSGLGGAPPVAGDDLIFPGGASNLSTSNDIAAGTSFNSITISGSGYTLAGNSITLGTGNLTDSNTSGANTVSVAISMSATRTFSISNAAETLTISGIISGSGGLTQSGNGNLILSGANTYNGATTINSGTLSISADNNLGTAPGSATTGQLTFAGGTLATTATFTLNPNRGIAFSSTGTIDVAPSTTLTYGGIAAGAGGLTKTSAGTLTLSANNTYTGTTTISAGKLLVNGSQGSSAVSLNGGTLGGTGTVGAVSSTSSGGTVAPGSGPGIINTGNVNWSSGSPTFSVEVNGTTVGSGYDQLNVTGTINLTGATLSGTTGFTPVKGTTFTIIKNNSGGAITGTFSGLAEGAVVSLGGQSFTISYVGGSGHDAVLTASGPNVTLDNSVNPSGSQPPDTDLVYTVTFTNTQCCAAQSLVITDPVPANTDFKVGSVTNSLGTTGLTVVVAYSNDGGTTWTYTPASGGGGASAGYDRNVTNIRWTFTGNLSQTGPNNTGSMSFTSKIR